MATSKDGTLVPISVISASDSPRRLRSCTARRLWRLRHLAGADVQCRTAAVAGTGRRARRGQHPRRRRVRRGVAPGRPADHEAELLRRLHRLRRAPRRSRHHQSRPAGDPRRLERRAADGRGAHPATRHAARGGRRRAGLDCCAPRRRRTAPSTSPSSARSSDPEQFARSAGLLAVPPRRGRDRLPGGAAHGGRARHRGSTPGTPRRWPPGCRPPPGRSIRCCSGWRPAATIDGSLDQMVEESTDIYSFLFDQLGLGYAAP